MQLDDYRLLGRSGLRVSPLALGTMTFGVQQSWGCDAAEAEKILGLYAESGGNSIDTANFYANGESERVVGKLVRNRRNRFVIATKYSLTMSPGDPNACGNHRKNMMQSVEESLRRLETDHIDLLYLHAWDARTPVEEILRAFDDLVRSGKVQYIGLSNTPAWQASRMQAIAELRGWSPLVALQISYSLAERSGERDLLPMAREMGLGVLPWSPLAGGVLSGKYQQKDLTSGAEPSKASARKDMNVSSGRLSDHSLVIADAVRKVAEEMNCSSAQVALAWTLLNPAVASPVLGIRTLAQLQDNLGALDVNFRADQIAQLDAASKIDLGVPHTMLASDVMSKMFGGVKVAKR
ncbi:aldo/keto reductase [Stenotrophobium rhamnosiphilum]|uniref:Aldo/keto reductase n=1 Tax=Stenotrophobium rhamnosiphilum TaxID=2029166 RepID=A0A2T5MC52_9GAMM|nr:aldo/keto reductase [Stenotrophobium rhamnosiphilum]PTU30158.1 aldo/keto reductase [Stenotrophobium rhamnosiphilum]